MLGGDKSIPSTAGAVVEAVIKMHFVQLKINKKSINFHYLTFESLCKDSIETSRSCFNFLELPFDEPVVDEFIEPQLNRSLNIKNNLHISKELIEKLDIFYDRLSERIL